MRVVDETDFINAQRVYKSVCEALDEHDFEYQKFEEDLVLTFAYDICGESMVFILQAQAELKLVRILSMMKQTFPEERRIEGALAVNYVNYSMNDGSFDLSVDDGEVYFKLTTSIRESLISPELVLYMIDYSRHACEMFCGNLAKLAKGEISLNEFVDEV